MTEWPGGRGLAAVINVMLEEWAPGSAPGLGPMGNPLPAGVTDYQALSWARYGARTGARKLQDVLRHRGAHATFYVSGVLARRQPDLVAAIAADGHEVAGHGWAQNIIPATLDKETERGQLRDCVAALTDACGTRPTGWISPRCTPSAHTAELLAEAGFTWFGDVFDDDDPYLLDTGHGPIVCLPFDMEVNDLPMLVRHGRPTGDLAAAFRDLLASALAEGKPAYLDITVHAHVTGRLAGRRQLDLILAELAGAGVWVATRDQVARHYLASRG